MEQTGMQDHERSMSLSLQRDRKYLTCSKNRFRVDDSTCPEARWVEVGFYDWTCPYHAAITFRHLRFGMSAYFYSDGSIGWIRNSGPANMHNFTGPCDD